MKHQIDLQHGHTTRIRYGTWRGNAIAVGIMACAIICDFQFAHAQSNALGVYQGTIKLSGTEIDPAVNYSASVKISLPVTQRDDNIISAEFFSGEAPAASVLISKWDEAHTEKSAGADGKFASYQCKLAAPIEIPMTPTGVLNIDLEDQTQTLSLTLLGTVDVEFNCVHSTSGAYKKKTGLGLYVGTGAPGLQYEHPLSLTDVAHLTANYTLVPGAGQENLGPIVQEWDLRLTQ